MCVHARTHARTHTRTHARMHTRMHARTHARTHAHAHAPLPFPPPLSNSQVDIDKAQPRRLLDPHSNEQHGQERGYAWLKGHERCAAADTGGGAQARGVQASSYAWPQFDLGPCVRCRQQAACLLAAGHESPEVA